MSLPHAERSCPPRSPHAVTPLRRGERVVAVSEITTDTIHIHGFGVYDHDTHAEHGHADVAALAGALAAADAVAADLGPLVDHLSRHASREWTERAQRRYRSARTAISAAPAHDRARALLASIPHQPRVHLDDGRSIDAHRCIVMRADTFPRYAHGTRVVKTAP